MKTQTIEEIRIQKTNERLSALSESGLRGLLKKVSIFVVGTDYSTVDANN